MKLIDSLSDRMATRLLAIVQNCVPPEEWRDAYREFRRVCKAGLVETKQETIRRLTKPWKN